MRQQDEWCLHAALEGPLELIPLMADGGKCLTPWLQLPLARGALLLPGLGKGLAEGLLSSVLAYGSVETRIPFPGQCSS